MRCAYPPYRKPPVGPLIFFLWRPYLVLEAAVAGECAGIVTFNQRDFAGAERFGLWIEDPRSFLARIGALP